MGCGWRTATGSIDGSLTFEKCWSEVHTSVCFGVRLPNVRKEKEKEKKNPAKKRLPKKFRARKREAGIPRTAFPATRTLRTHSTLVPPKNVEESVIAVIASMHFSREIDPLTGDPACRSCAILGVHCEQRRGLTASVDWQPEQTSLILSETVKRAKVRASCRWLLMPDGGGCSLTTRPLAPRQAHAAISSWTDYDAVQHMKLSLAWIQTALSSLLRLMPRF